MLWCVYTFSTWLCKIRLFSAKKITLNNIVFINYFKIFFIYFRFRSYIIEKKNKTMMNNEAFYKLALTMLPGCGLQKQHEILKHFGTAEAFFKAAARQQCLDFKGGDDGTVVGGRASSAGGGKAGRGADWKDLGNLTQAQKQAEAELNFAEKNGLHVCLIHSADYPPLLGDCPDAPLVLFVRSVLPPTHPDHALKRPALGIVGTRKASHYGREQTNCLIAELRNEPIVTISGLALGIDTQAHRSSLQHGLPTIAVVGHGLDQIYPPANEGLAQEIVDAGGAIITEMPSGTAIKAGLFPRRNRIIAGLSLAVVVAEAAVDGGALITARIAHSYNRALFAFPGKNDMTFSRGCNRLIKAQMAQLLESADDLLSEVAWTWGERLEKRSLGERRLGEQTLDDKARPLPQHSAERGLSAPQQQLLQIIRRESPALLELLSGETQRPLPDLLTDLLALELTGLIRSLPGERYENT